MTAIASFRSRAPLALTLLCLFVVLSGSLAAQERLALVGGTLIDGTGARALRNSVVLVEDGRIVQVGAQGRLAVPEDYAVLSTEGLTVLPGLWDPHVHLL